MDISAARLAVLGVVQGLTEFLPVSSSGHLAALGNAFGGFEALLPVTVALHAATLAAVLFFWRRDIIDALKTPRAWMLVAAVSLPTAAIGLGLKGAVERIFAGNVVWVYIFMAVTGGVIFASSRVKPPAVAGGDFWRGVPLAAAVAVGIAQGVAVLPGISRSGATIAVAMFAGMSGKDAAKFSFISSIPAVSGAALLEFRNFFTGAENVFSGGISYASLATAMFLAFIAGVFAIRFLIGALETRRFGYFSYYLWAVSAAGLIYGR